MASRSPRAASSSKPASRSRGSRSRSSRQVSCDLVRRFREPIAALFLYASPLSLSPRSGFFMKRNKVQDLRVSDFMSTDLVTASPDETLGDVLGKMKSNDIHELPVIERKKLVGVVTMRELMRRRNLPPATKVSTALEIPPESSPETPLPEAAEKMISAGFRAIPVVKGKSLVGIISRSDIVRALVETRALEGILVRDFMTPNPQAVAEDDTVEHAVQIMRSLGERSVPVVDKHRHLRGVVGLKDVVELLAPPKVREQYRGRAAREEKLVIELQSDKPDPPLTLDPDGGTHRPAERTTKRPGS